MDVDASAGVEPPAPSAEPLAHVTDWGAITGANASGVPVQPLVANSSDPAEKARLEAEADLHRQATNVTRVTCSTVLGQAKSELELSTRYSPYGGAPVAAGSPPSVPASSGGDASSTLADEGRSCG